MSIKENKSIVRRYLAVFNEKNVDVLDAFVAADLDHHGFGTSTLEGYKRSLADTFGSFPDVHYTIHDVIAEDEKVTARWTGSGTQKGEVFGIPPTGKQVTWTGINIFRFADGKIVEVWFEGNILGLYRQLGVYAPLGTGEE
jgi:steroid delta-isomerase-like uncharacterized protein